VKVLIIGSGGREHALAWKIGQSPEVEQIFCAPGNPGMAELGECIDIGVNDFEALVAFAKKHDVGLTVVGPEDPLAGGIVDVFEAAGLRAFGPSGAAAQIEGSKAFAKRLMARCNIPTSEYAEFDDADAAIAYVRDKGAPIVIKADGLAAGKGVTVAHDVETAVAAIREAMVDQVFGDAGARVVVEECLFGEEASIFALTDGETVLPLISSQDHKPVYDGDEGPNTGGMGAYSPAPVVTDALFQEIEERVLRPTVEGMRTDGVPYKGVLYAGLMIGENGPKVVEFNCRFGDPETQVVLPPMKSDLVPLLAACADGSLADHSVEWDAGACVTVVMASGGYPKAYEKGKVIEGIARAEVDPDVMVFHAGTALKNGALITNGGRVLNVTARDDTIPAAIDRAYEAVGKVSFEAAHHRMDIGQKALKRL
jgi:phosphoribosylamine---glycine ligase